MPDILTLAMAMKRGGGSASWDNIKNKPVIPAAYETRKIKPQLYEIWFTDIDYKTANEYFENGGDVAVGACSAVRNGNFYGRNFDWLYGNNAEFIVHVPRIADRYASIGIATSVNTLTEEFVDSGEPSDAYGIVPFKTVDGINEFGVIANNNVVPTDKELETIIPSGAVEVELQSTMLVRFILDHFKTAKEAVEYIQEHVKINLSQKLLNMHYEQHYMVADKDKTYLIELIGAEAVVTDMTAGAESALAGKPYMTNFYLSDVTLNSDGTVYTPYTQDATHNAIDTNGITENGAGLERYNTIAAGYASANTANGMRALMNSLKYTNAYTLTDADDVWYSEFVGVNDLTCASPYTDYADVLTAARGMYEDRDRDEPDTWQTVHSVVYDITGLTMSVIPQESGEAVERTLQPDGASVSKVKETARKIDILSRLTRGQTWDEEIDTTEAYSKTIPENTHAVGVEVIGGKTVVLNQLVPSGGSDIVTVSGHKYYTSTAGDEEILTSEGETLTTEPGDVLIDLTLMFGPTVANGITTPEQAFALGVPREAMPYNAGEITHAAVDAVVIRRNGTEIARMEIPAAVRARPGYGWASRNAANLIEYDANFGKWYLVHYVDVVNIGNLNWISSTEQGEHRIFFATLPNAARDYDITSFVQAEFEPYVASSLGGVANAQFDRIIVKNKGTGTNPGRVVIRDDQYESAADFKGANTNVAIYYTLSDESVSREDVTGLMPPYDLLDCAAGDVLTFEQTGTLELPVPNELNHLKQTNVVNGVQVAGTDLTPDVDGKVNVPIATSETPGVARFYSRRGIWMDGTAAALSQASNDAITERSTYNANGYGAITPANLNFAVKAALSSNGQITSADLPSIQATLGIVTLTQEEYDLMAAHDANTLYVITAGDAS